MFDFIKKVFGIQISSSAKPEIEINVISPVIVSDFKAEKYHLELPPGTQIKKGSCDCCGCYFLGCEW